MPDMSIPEPRSAGLIEGGLQGFASPHSEMFSDNRTYRGTQTVTAGEVSFAETHRYEDVTAKSRHSPGTPFSW